LNRCCPVADERLTRAGDVGASNLPVCGANAVITRSKSGAGNALKIEIWHIRHRSETF
jgi:hypothetical protein